MRGTANEDFADAERARLPSIGAAVAAAAELLVQGRAEKSMSLFNRRDMPADRILLPRRVTAATP